MKKIVIDAGHGGRDVGAVGPTGLKEASVNLDIALRLRQMAESEGIEVYLTRSQNEFLELQERADRANACAPDLFVSIHCNAATTAQASGFEVWTTPGQTPSDDFAESIVRALNHAFPNEPLRADLQDGDRDREANFLVLKKTSCPAVLVETGFISHPDTEASMRTPEWRTKMAESILSGIVEGLQE